MSEWPDAQSLKCLEDWAKLDMWRRYEIYRGGSWRIELFQGAEDGIETRVGYSIAARSFCDAVHDALAQAINKEPTK